MNFIHDLAVANQNRSLEWDPDGKLTTAFFSNELCGEVGELLEKARHIIAFSASIGKIANSVKKLEREALGLRGSRVGHEELEDEFGDALICLSLLANAFDINLEEVTRRKFNKTSKKLKLDVFL